MFPAIAEQGGQPERRIGRILKSKVLGRRPVTFDVLPKTETYDSRKPPPSKPSMKYLLIAVALLVVGLIAFVMTRKPEPITEVVATYDGNPEEYNGNKTLLVAVHAKWASVWRATAEVLANLDTEQYDIKLLNADEDRDAVKALGVDIIPTVIVFKDGAEIARLPNMMNANQLP